MAAAAAAAAAARGVMRFGSVLIQDVGNKIEREKLEKSSRPGEGRVDKFTSTFQFQLSKQAQTEFEKN